MRPVLERLQPLGRALMLPIAVLPVAALLLRLGQPDLLDIAFIAAAGAAIFSNLGLLFAIGVGIGLARENHGAAGLAGAVAYLVAVEGAKALLSVSPDTTARIADPVLRELAASAWKARELAKLSVPCGIAAGVVAGTLYNRYATIKLPDALAFFGGRRFVPMAAGLAGIGLAVLFGLGAPLLGQGIDGFSRWVTEAGSIGLVLFGMANRLLIVTGLHHILNNIAWFVLGSFDGASGDLNRFFAGDPGAGAFMTGFFPVMMFGLPAACLAMYHAAPPGRRKAVAGQLLSLALTSFLTGVTEPIEFTFIFLAPLLFAVHAVLTGLAMAVMDAAGVRLGFGFSAGLFDLVLNFHLSTRGWLLLPVGLVYASLYYVLFRWCIVRFDLKTPGRENEARRLQPARTGTERAKAFVEALGGTANVLAVNACTTRLRLTVTDEALLQRAALKALGAAGVIGVGRGEVQVVLGPNADLIAGEIRAELRGQERDDRLPAPLVAALGGDANIKDCASLAGRIRITLHDAAAADAAAVDALTSGRAAFIGPSTIHLVPGG